MSDLNVTELCADLLIVSLEELAQRLDPDSGSHYCATCNVPDFQLSPQIKQRIEAAKAAQTVGNSVQVLEIGADIFVLLRAQIRQSPGAPSDLAQLELILQRVWFPVLLAMLRQGYVKQTGGWQTFSKILYFLLVAVSMFDDRLQEWMTQESSPERIAALGGAGIKRWFGAQDKENPENTVIQAEIPYLIVDIIGIAAFIFRGRIAPFVNRDSPFWVAYGWEPLSPVEFPISEAIAERTLSLWWEIYPELTAKASNYELAPPAAPAAKFLGLTLVPLLESQGGPAVIPLLQANLNGTYKFADQWELEITGQPTFPVPSATLELALRRKQPKTKDTVGTSKTKKGLSFTLTEIELVSKVKFDVVNKAQNDLGAVVRLKKAELSLLGGSTPASPGDSKLLQRALPNGIGGTVNLGVGLSWRSGFYWEGGLGVEVYAPIAWETPDIKGISVEVPHVQLRLEGKTSNAATQVGLEARLGLTLNMGPVKVFTGGLGAALRLAHQRQGQGNLGGFDVEFDLLEPTSFGLSINAKAVRGEGFLARDAAKDRWLGALSLSLDVDWKIFDKTCSLSGLVFTEGDSVLGMVWVQGLMISLLGGQIEGLGILVACDRRGDRDAFLQGMQSNVLDTILFPTDLVQQAPQLINTLSQLFPLARDRTVVGLMVQWVFGQAARLVVIELGILVELGGGAIHHIYLLGQGTIRSKKLPETLFLINVELFGDLDFETDQFFIKLSLRNSKLAGGDLTGDGLIYFDGDGQFLLSVGGFNPRYPVPQNSLFALSRLAVNLANRDHLRLTFQAYVALTHNSFQIGGRLQIWAGAAGFSLEGLLSLDVLVRFNLEFFVDIHLSVAIKRGSRNLASVSFEGTLSGISTWRLNGSAKISLLFFSIKIPVSFTFGSSAPAQFDPVDAVQVLQQALQAPDNWVSTRSDLGVTLLSAPRAGVWLAAHSSLRVSQTVIPLEQTITRLGPSPLRQPQRFSIAQAALGTATTSAIAPVQAQFAPGLFWDVDLDEALRSPSFERMTAGCEFTDAGVSFGEVVSADMEYEIIAPIDDFGVAKAPLQASTIQTLDASLLTSTTPIPASTFYRAAVNPVVLLPRRYGVADVSLRSARLPNQAVTQLTYFQARELRRAAKTQRLHVVSSYEIAPNA